jgi:hypothetical protein
MKPRLVIAILTVLIPGLALAQDTAYKALKTVGKQRGETALNQIVLMVGQAGRTQPVNWNVSLSDPAARGGVRELEITSGVIASERAPVRPGLANGVPIDLSKLNVDSDGAFRLAEQEAARNQVAFDSVNYRLSTDSATGQPVWTLDLVDSSERPVGLVQIGADSGILIRGTNWVPGEGSRVASRRQYDSSGGPVRQTAPPDYPDRSVSDYRDPAYRDHPVDNSDDHSGETVSERANRYGASVIHFGETVAHKTVRAARKVGGWFQKKFTGQNTLDEDQADERYESEPPPPAAAQDPYSQPVRPSKPE